MKTSFPRTAKLCHRPGRSHLPDLCSDGNGPCQSCAYARALKTGKPSRDPALYREVVRRIRDSGSDVLINLTTGRPVAAITAACPDS